MIKLFLGYDQRETIAYHVCSNSIIRNSNSLLSITPLYLKNLNNYVEKHVDGSNDFIYSRFLVPYLNDFKGWAIYIDGDMILRDDINELWSMRDDEKAVMVVKHSYTTRKSVKYMGAKNENYPRKNWSSVVLWNCAHKSNKILTPEFIQSSNGAFLHRFSWLKDIDIGELPLEWNWLPDEFGRNESAKLLHWTLGAPCFHDFASEPMAEEWHRERIYMNHCNQNN
jgi:lipopolysaccharide biosynthesis glycosyltransferase